MHRTANVADNYYNAVLLPPAALAADFMQFAAQHFASIADGYCLSPQGCLPHVTLCQTPLLAAKAASALWGRLKCLELPPALALSCSYYTARYGPRADGGAPVVYCGLGIRLPNAALTALHETVADIYASEAIEPRNPSRASYWPHLTLARMPPAATVPAMTFPDWFWHDHGGWRLGFGQGDIAGQLLTLL